MILKSTLHKPGQLNNRDEQTDEICSRKHLQFPYSLCPGREGCYFAITLLPRRSLPEQQTAGLKSSAPTLEATEVRAKCSSTPEQQSLCSSTLLPATRAACPAQNKPISLPLLPQMNSISSCPSASFLVRLILLCTPVFDDLPSKPGTMSRNPALPLVPLPRGSQVFREGRSPWLRRVTKGHL